MTDYQRALACANAYRKRGLTPLPSRMDRKGPALASFAEHYKGVPVPEQVYRDWNTTNIQIITGTGHAGPLKIAVVDLDGPEAPAAWETLCRLHNYTPSTSWVSRTGSGGTHLYYTLSEDIKSCPSGMLWGIWDTCGTDGKGQWMKHREIRLLADNALVIAPPSIHVETNERYAFIPGSDPKKIPIPETMPEWIVKLPRLVAPRASTPTERPRFDPGCIRKVSRFKSHAEVIDSIPDIISLAQSWGLVLAARTPNEHGWISCFVPWRESPDQGSSPSGSLHATGGVFQDRRDDSAITLFDLGSILQPGIFPDWRSCKDWCSSRF